MKEPIYRFKRDREIGRMDKIVCLAFLEEVELPTEEEIEAVLIDEYNKSEFSWIERTAKAITNLLKGER